MIESGTPVPGESTQTMEDGSIITVRPIRPTDADSLVSFHTGLSMETTRLRYFSPHPRLSAREVEHYTTVDHHRREALAAFDGDDLVGVARYETLDDAGDAEVAFVVADRWHAHGVGTMLLRELATRGHDEGIRRFVADTMADNRNMVGVFDHSGLPFTRSFDRGVVHYVLGPLTSGVTVVQRLQAVQETDPWVERS